MSSKKDREKRREERLAQESKVESKDQRKRILQIGAGAVFVAVVAVIVLIVLNSGGDDGGDTKLEGVKDVDSLIEGIPQEGLKLGDPKAKVTLIEFGDLQCPVCKGFSEEVLPQIVENQVQHGEAAIEFRNFIIISEESVPAGEALVAAGKQGRGWEFLELFYRNQGEERSGYVTDDFLLAVAKGAGVPDIAQWEEDRKSKAVKQEVSSTSAQAQKYGFTGTPSFAVEGPGADGGLELIGTTEADGLEEAIKQAAG
jgi:protein-disulfide isomerase